MLDDAGDVAHAVCVAVGEGPRIDLVQDAVLHHGASDGLTPPGPRRRAAASRQGERSSIG